MLVSAAEGHRLWAPIYDDLPNPLLALERRIVIALLGDTIPSSLIDVGCGTGRWMLHFQQFGTSASGVDACQEMLEEAERHPSLRGRVILGQAEALPWPDEAADLAICSFAAAYLRDLPLVLREISRVCIPGARVVLSDMHWLAAAADWRRSFKIGAHLYEIEHYFYSRRELCAAAASAGLRLETQVDGFFDEPERQAFERAGKESLFSRLSAIPAIWVGLWIKP